MPLQVADVPVEIPAKKKGQPPVIFDKTKGRAKTPPSKCCVRLSQPSERWHVTAGNAPGVNDGAAALVVTSAARAKELGATVMVRIVAQATAVSSRSGS